MPTPLQKALCSVLVMAQKDPSQREEALALSKAVAAAGVRFSTTAPKTPKPKKGGTS